LFHEVDQDRIQTDFDHMTAGHDNYRLTFAAGRDYTPDQAFQIIGLEIAGQAFEKLLGPGHYGNSGLALNTGQ
jgi:hypothetical protein